MQKNYQQFHHLQALQMVPFLNGRIEMGWQWIVRIKGLVKKVLFINILIICFVFTSCERTMKLDTPRNVVWTMNFTIGRNDYEGFNNLFCQGRIKKD